MDYKNCSKCKTQKPKTDFRKNNKTKDKLDSWCKVCHHEQYKENYAKNKSKWLERSITWRKKHPKRSKEISARWKKANKKKVNETEKNRFYNLRRKALEKIGLLVCNNCGCDEYNLLEINHINGDGCQERKVKQTGKFYLEIVNGTRTTDDLNILCKPCNLLHYLELRHGKLPYKIEWEKLLSGHETKK